MTKPSAIFFTLGILIFALLLPQIRNSANQVIGIGLGVTAFFAGLFELKDQSGTFRFSKAVSLAFVFYSSAFFFCQYTPIGEWMSRPLLLPHSSEKGEAIVSVAGGVHRQGRPTFAGLQRVLHASHLFTQGQAPLLVISGSAYIAEDGYTEADWVSSLTKRLGIPANQLVIVNKGLTTVTEASGVAEELKARKIKTILVVTNGPHILRTVRCYEKHGFKVLPAPVNDSYTLDSTTDSRLSLVNYAVHEWIGNIVYWLRGNIEFPFG